MTSKRLLDIFGLMAKRANTGPTGGSLCAVAAEFIQLDGATISLVSGDNQLTSLCASNVVSKKLLGLEVTLGEGPTTDACSGDGVVRVPDLSVATDQSWLSYVPSASAMGAASVFAFPVAMGAVRLGALTFFRWQPGPLSDAQEADAFLMASVVARAILDLQAGAPRGSLATQLEREARFDFSVHQAAGMIAVQAKMSVGDALVALRAHAFATNQGVAELSAKVVARQIRYDHASAKWREVAGGGE